MAVVKIVSGDIAHKAMGHSIGVVVETALDHLDRDTVKGLVQGVRHIITQVDEDGIE